MQRFKSFGSVFTLALLAGCGGGGSGSGVGSTPTPVGPDPVSRSTSLTNVTQNDDFAASIKATTFTISKANGSGTPGSGGIVGTSNTTVHYDAATKGYSIDVLPLSTGSRLSFNESNKVAAKSNATLTTYEKKSGSRTENLLLFNPGSSNPNFALTYTSYGAWLTIDDRSSSLDNTVAYFTFGTRTSSADMPRSGSASYNTILDGTYADQDGFYALAGTSSFSADFASSTISFQIDPVGHNMVNGGTKALGSYSGTGTIDASTARFAASPVSYGSYQMSGLHGYFYGPGAAEMGGTFGLSAMGGTGVGVIVGKKN